MKMTRESKQHIEQVAEEVLVQLDNIAEVASNKLKESRLKYPQALDLMIKYGLSNHVFPPINDATVFISGGSSLSP